MPTMIDDKVTGEVFQSIGRRTDGSIRQILVQDENKNVLARGYFPHGTQITDDLKAKRMYSWVDAFTDEELTNPINELIFSIDADVLKQKREEAVVANKEKIFVIEDIEDYKISNYRKRA